MRKPDAPPAVIGLAVGGMCAALVLAWLWRQTPTPSPPAAPIPVPAHTPTPVPVLPATATAQTTRLEQAARDLITMLEHVFAHTPRRPHEALLVFKNDAAQQRFLERAGKAGLTVLGESGALRAVRVRYENLGDVETDLVAHAGDYASVGANGLISIPEPPPKQDRAVGDQVPFGNRTLNYLGVASDNSAWGRGVTVAVLDTGVAAADPTFAGGRLRAIDIGLGVAPGNGNEDGHATAVAALAAGGARDAAGVAPAANVLSIRVTDAAGTSDIFAISQGIVTAVDAGAKIVNISLGGYATNGVLDAAIGYAIDHGALIVAAAGNDQAAQLAWPAADPRVISVGAIDAAEQQVSFSNSGEQLQLTAPGLGVQTAWLNGQRAYVDGTSVSAPLVTGALAAVLSQNPTLTPAQAAQLLVQTASDGGAPGADPAFGKGILDVGWAMNAGNTSYVDTAISSHYYDAANHQLDVVVQNRSGRSVTGTTLNTDVSGQAATFNVPSLAPGETYVAKLPVDDLALKQNGSLTFTTQLVNPIGVEDKVPTNNRRTSVLTAPAPPAAKP